MSSPMEYLLARALIEERMREVNHRHLAREARQGEPPSPAATPVKRARRHSRVWSLVHLRRATS
jgi:hypothetical protein